MVLGLENIKDMAVVHMKKILSKVFTFNSNKTWSGTKYEYNIIRENENGTFIYYKDAKAIKLNIENINGFTPTYYILELEGRLLNTRFR